jgi:hypothetical protein
MPEFKFPRESVKKVDGPRVESMPLIALQGIGAIREHLDAAERVAIPSAIAKGATVEEIALALGITRQGAHYKIRKFRGSEQDSVEEVTTLAAGQEPVDEDDADGDAEEER